jgi:hypothetical protein
MPETTDPRVAVYIDFDNIVISRFQEVHGRGSGRIALRSVVTGTDPAVDAMIVGATVDVGAILDFASSYGSIVVSRAYADWSVSVNADYRKQLIDRAVDLVQLFPTVTSMKNGADIRLAVDVVEDLFLLPDITHVVIVAGDSDYIALAQKSRRLGRYVVGIGVAGSSSASLAAACDDFFNYDALPGIDIVAEAAEDIGVIEDAAPEPANAPETRKKTAKAPQQQAPNRQRQATKLLVRALRLLLAKDDADWIPSTSVKNQMLRMDPTFSEKELGFGSFTDFLKSRGNITEIDDNAGPRRLRLRPEFDERPDPAG